MKNVRELLLCALAFLVMPAGALMAQTRDITGTWQGTLKTPNATLRIVVKISTATDGSLKGTFYSIDQGGQGMPATSVTLEGSAVKISMTAIAGTYDGKLSADGNAIVGTWSQGASPLPLDLVRATEETAWTIPAPPPPVKPMAADANPSFEVATIKPSNPDRPGKAFLVRGRQFSTLNTTTSEMIAFAYGVQARQIVGGPDWLDKDKYDLLAVPDGEGQPNSDQWKMMLRKLLADRFQLVFHHDKKELSVYAIVVAKNGPKLAKSQADPHGLPSLFFRGLGTLPAANATIGDLAGVLQGAVLDRPVVDQTGLTGKYDFTLTWTPDQFQFRGMGATPPAPSDNPSAPPDLFTAMQDELGLKLESTKASVDVMVLDKVERPSAN